MEDRFDFRAIRTLPVTICVLLINSIFGVVYVALTISIKGFDLDDAIIGFPGGMALTFEMIEYIIIVTITQCIYRIIDQNKNFGISFNMFLSFILSELAYRLLKGILSDTSATWAFVVFTVIKVITQMGVVLGVFFMLRGLAELNAKIDKVKLAEAIKKISAVWVVSGGLILILKLFIMPTLSVAEGGIYFVARIVAWLIVAFYFASFFIVFKRCKMACFEYYLYKYNRSIRY